MLVAITSLGLTAVDFLAVSIGWGSGADKTTSAMFFGMAVVSLVRFKSTPPSSSCLCRPLRRREAGRQAVTDADKLGLLEFPHSLITSRREDVAAAKKHLCDSG